MIKLADHLITILQLDYLMLTEEKKTMKLTIMSWMNEGDYEQPERLRHNHNLIHQYLINDIEIRNEGYIDSIKDTNNVRIMSLNVKGLDPWKYEKMERFIDSCQRIQIDVMMLNEVNVKWIPANIDKMEQ